MCGADLHSKNKQGYKPIERASLAGREKVMAYLKKFMVLPATYALEFENFHPRGEPQEAPDTSKLLLTITAPESAPEVEARRETPSRLNLMSPVTFQGAGPETKGQMRRPASAGSISQMDRSSLSSRSKIFFQRSKGGALGKKGVGVNLENPEDPSGSEGFISPRHTKHMPRHHPASRAEVFHMIKTLPPRPKYQVEQSPTFDPFALVKPTA